MRCNCHQDGIPNIRLWETALDWGLCSSQLCVQCTSGTLTLSMTDGHLQNRQTAPFEGMSFLFCFAALGTILKADALSCIPARFYFESGLH